MYSLGLRTIMYAKPGSPWIFFQQDVHVHV